MLLLVGERVVSLHLWVRDSSEYPGFLESLCGVLEDAPCGDSVVLLWVFSNHIGNNSKTWRHGAWLGRTTCLIWTWVLFCYLICANNSLFKTTTIFEYKVPSGLVGALEVAEGSRQEVAEAKTRICEEFGNSSHTVYSGVGCFWLNLRTSLLIVFKHFFNLLTFCRILKHKT